MPDLDQRRRSTVERVVALILRELPDADHARKWGRLTFTRGGDWHHWICAISPGKDAVKLTIHKGALLADPHEVLEGNGRYVRAIAFRAPEEIDPAWSHRSSARPPPARRRCCRAEPPSAYPTLTSA